MDAAQRRNDFVDHAIGEIFLFGVATHIGKWQDGNRRLVGKGKRSTYNRSSGLRDLVSDPVCLDRLSDIFNLLLAEYRRRTRAALCQSDPSRYRRRKSHPAPQELPNGLRY